MNKKDPVPKITVITVCYNAADTIGRTLESIVSQTYPQIEYLVIDGASTDDTLKKVRTSCPEAKILSEKDNGIYDAMNKGISMASGDFLLFMNAGDAFYKPETVSDILSPPQAKTADIIYGDTVIIDSSDKELCLRHLRPPLRLTEQSFSKGMLVCHQAFIVRRNIAPIFDLRYRFSADYDWCIRAMQAADTIYNSEEIIARYLHEGITTRNHRASLLERFRIMSHYFGIFPTVFRHIGFLFR